MSVLVQAEKLSKVEQKVAIESYNALTSAIRQISSEETEIAIEETKDKIKIPLSALKLLGDVLKGMSEGKKMSIIPTATEVTTQQAAETLGCSRPYLIKLLENGKIEYTKVGKHRRVNVEDVLAYKKRMKENQKQHIIGIMNFDEQTGMYDSL